MMIVVEAIGTLLATLIGGVSPCCWLFWCRLLLTPFR